MPWSRCRANSIGLIGEFKVTQSQTEVTTMMTESQLSSTYLAVASNDGRRVNVNLTEADHLLIYDLSVPIPKLVGLRKIPSLTTDGFLWTTLATLLEDCSLLFTGGIGPIPKALLQQNGVRVHTVRGRISDLLTKVDVIMVADDDVPFVCSKSCHGGPRECRCEMA